MAEINRAYLNPKSGNLMTPKGRLLWNSLFKPRKAKGTDGKAGKYEFNLLIPKDADITVLKEAALEAGKEKFSRAFKDAGAGKWPSSIKGPFKKTADNDKLAELAVDYPWFIAARSQDAPQVVGPDGKKESVTEEDVYTGRWCRASVQAFAYETGGNRGVTFGLINVQMLHDDEELVIGGSRVSAESEFEDTEGAGDDSKSSDDVFA